MVLFNTKSHQVIYDAVEQITNKTNLSIWVHGNSGRPIAFSDELEDKGYVFLSEDAPEVIKAKKDQENKKQLIEYECKLAKERMKQEAAMIQQEEVLQRKKAEERKALLDNIVPKGNIMPAWFDKYVRKLPINKEKQDKIRKTFSYSREEWVDYFFSSFPSSFLASYKIIGNLLENEVVRNEYSKLTMIRIADIGCGTGGAAIGAITAIEQFLPNVSKIEIDAFDYSEIALDVFSNCLDAYPSKIVELKTKRIIKLVPEHSDEAQREYTLEDFDSKYLNNEKFDFILCFKMVNELIFNNNFGHNEYTYSKIAQIASPHISEKGFFILLDVSQSKEKDKSDNCIDNTKYAYLLNKGIRNFLSNNINYNCIIPIPCAIKPDCKADYCWIQRLITPEGGREFPATYKVLTRTNFSKQILESIQDEDTSKYIVSELKRKTYKRCIYKHGERTGSDEITEDEIQNYKNGFCLK